MKLPSKVVCISDYFQKLSNEIKSHVISRGGQIPAIGDEFTPVDLFKGSSRPGRPIDSDIHPGDDYYYLFKECGRHIAYEAVCFTTLDEEEISIEKEIEEPALV